MILAVYASVLFFVYSCHQNLKVIYDTKNLGIIILKTEKKQPSFHSLILGYYLYIMLLDTHMCLDAPQATSSSFLQLTHHKQAHHCFPCFC